MKYFKRYLLLSLLLAGFATSLQGQGLLNYKQYMQNVKTNNLAYLAQKYELDIANANIEATKVFQDPAFSLGAANNQDHSMKMGRSIDAGLSYTLELGGKRGARMDVSKTELALSASQLESFFYQLQADATLAYLDALKAKQLYRVGQVSYKIMDQLAQGDSIRFKLGEIKLIDEQQSQLEAKSMYNDLLQSEGDYKNALLKLSIMGGDSLLQAADSIAGDISYLKRDFVLQTLIVHAQEHRVDLQAAGLSKQLSQQNLRLAKADRAIDLDLNVDFSHNTEALNEIAPSPAYNSLSVGLSIPLKFSNTNKGAVHAAKFEIAQSEVQYRNIKLQIQAEVIQAYTNYSVASRQVEAYNGGILSSAQNILNKKIYSYKHGESSLLEVLDAQRTYDEVQQNYYQCLYNCAAALVELERASQVWDIDI